MVIRMSQWSVAQAKAGFSELLREASNAPQAIENRGKAVAVVLSVEAYDRLREQAERASGTTKISELLRISAELRASGGAELDIPKREARVSPFAAPKPRRTR